MNVINLGRKVKHRYEIYFRKNKTKLNKTKYQNPKPYVIERWCGVTGSGSSSFKSLGLSLSDVNQGLWSQCSDKFLLALKFHKASVTEVMRFIHQL